VDIAMDDRLRNLVTRSVSGDGVAFSELVEPYLREAWSLASLICGHRCDPMDPMQDALLSAWKDLRKLREPTAFRAWFFKHVSRAALKSAKNERRGAQVEGRMDPGEDSIDRQVAGRTLLRAISALAARDRAVIVARYYLGLTDKETGHLLSIPEGTVKSRLSSAMQRLRASYDAEERR
jgi:RNA polymerase sigma factor (sigma-70 family)